MPEEFDALEDIVSLSAPASTAQGQPKFRPKSRANVGRAAAAAVSKGGDRKSELSDAGASKQRIQGRDAPEKTTATAEVTSAALKEDATAVCLNADGQGGINEKSLKSVPVDVTEHNVESDAVKRISDALSKNSCAEISPELTKDSCEKSIISDGFMDPSAVDPAECANEGEGSTLEAQEDSALRSNSSEEQHAECNQVGDYPGELEVDEQMVSMVADEISINPSVKIGNSKVKTRRNKSRLESVSFSLPDACTLPEADISGKSRDAACVTGNGGGHHFDNEVESTAADKISKLDTERSEMSMELRKRKETPKDRTSESWTFDDFDIEPTDFSVEVSDNDDGEYTVARKKVPKRSKVEKESNAQPANCKRSSKKSGSSAQETPNKLPHRVRQRRRKVDAHLLEMPEEEIDRRQITIKNLILYAEAKEKSWSKDAAAGVYPNGRRRYNDAFSMFEDDEDANDNGDGHNQQSSTKLNYHSYMKRNNSMRWSQSDTDLFYQALRQFGTDFTLIQHLFPSRNRHQIKLKFKSEDRKHPFKVQEALNYRSTDQSHFKKVIEQMQSENQEKRAADNFETGENYSYDVEDDDAESHEKEEDPSDLNDWQDNLKSSVDCGGADDGKQSSSPAADIDSLFDW